MNFLEMKTKIRNQIFVEGEQENLIAVHDAFFQQAFYDIQVACPCATFANLSVIPHCATYFNCGMTVVPKPSGVITEVYVIDKLNPETGLEDAEADDQYCSKVFYQPVDFHSMSRYVKLCERCGTSSATADALANLLFGAYRTKRRYPKPTDEGMEGLAKLQEGYHYPQASTDAEGRSPFGVYALHRGRIYIAPWIQSTESLVLKSNGIKRVWADADIVDDDPKFEQAVRLHVSHQHESTYGDPARAQDFFEQLRGPIGAIPVLIHQCQEESRSHSVAEASAMGMAVGIGTSAANALFYNDTKFTYTARCPTGQTGSPVTVIKEVGSVSSALSVADANARASSAAADEATSQLVCETPAVTYYNTPQTYTANCPGADADTGTPAAVGSSVTVTIAANKYSSTVSQAAADAAALAAATSQAGSQLVCTFYNAAVTVTVECPTGTVGADVTKTVAAGVYSSTTSQADANEQASAAATNEATADLSCGADTVIVFNTLQTGYYTAYCPTTQAPLTATSNVVQGYYTAISQNTPAAIANTRAILNQQALNLANQRAFTVWQQQC